jgi:hypothetical protein
MAVNGSTAFSFGSFEVKKEDENEAEKKDGQKVFDPEYRCDRRDRFYITLRLDGRR